MNKTILVTGANGGLGKDTARQLALIKETEKIYLACRNETKAKVAKKSFESSTLNINQVMYNVGYIDDKAFRKTFKKYTGLSPLEYRRKFNREMAFS